MGIDIFDALMAGRAAYSNTKDLIGKMAGISIAPVYEVFEDDTITVLLPESGGRSPSPRLYRCLPSWFLTYPAVRKGDTVVYGFIEGNPNKGVYWGVLHNAVNPPSSLDRFTQLLGNTSVVITEDLLSHYWADDLEQTKLSGTVITEEGVKVEKKGTIGASIELTDGTVVIQTGATTYTFSQGGLDVSVDGGGGSSGSFTLTNMNSVSINGKQVATIGATDEDGDDLITRGWD